MLKFDAGRRELPSDLTWTMVALALAAVVALLPVPILTWVGAFLLLIVLPGLQVVRWLGLYAGWREVRTIVLSVASGALVMPIFLYWASLIFGFYRPLVFAVPIVLTVVLALINAARPLPKLVPSPVCQTRRQYLVLGLVLLMLLIGLLLPYLRYHTPDGIFPVEMGDWFKHYGVSWAIRNTGVPPVDVFFYGDPARGPLSYYYFFHLMVASLDILHAGLSSIYISYVLMTLTVSLGFVLVFYFLAQEILRKTGAALWSLFFAALVGGLDLIPIIPRMVDLKNKESSGATSGNFFLSDHVDNWASALALRLNSLFTTFIWVPQHVGGLLAFFMGLYLLRQVSHRFRLATVAPFVLLSMLGQSAWIALITFGCLGLYGVFDVVSAWRSSSHAGLRRLGEWSLVAVALLVISAPLLLEFAGPNAPRNGIAFAIPESNQYLGFFRTVFPDSAPVRLLDLAIQFFFELGALLVCGLAGLRLFWKQRRDEPLLPLLGLTLALGFLAISFFASGRGWISLGFTLNNDLGMRALMPAQAVLALFAGYYLFYLKNLRIGWLWKPVWIGVIGVMVVLGILAFAWEVYSMGIAKYFKPPRVDAATYQAYQAMQSLTEPLSSVKHRSENNASTYQLMYADRPVGFFRIEAAYFHPDLRQVAYAFELSRLAYQNRLPIWSYQMFLEMGADNVYVGAIDRSPDLYPQKFENSTYYRRLFEEGDIGIYQVRDLGLDTVQADFTPSGMKYKGYILDRSPVYPAGLESEAPEAIVTAWQLDQPTDEDYTVYVHFVDPEGRVIGQADHQLWSWSGKTEGPTSTWQPGKTYLDIFPVPAEVLDTPTTLYIGIGLWVPETGEHQEAYTTQLTFDSGNRLVVGAYPVLSQ